MNVHIRETFFTGFNVGFSAAPSLIRVIINGAVGTKSSEKNGFLNLLSKKIRSVLITMSFDNFVI